MAKFVSLDLCGSPLGEHITSCGVVRMDGAVTTEAVSFDPLTGLGDWPAHIWADISIMVRRNLTSHELARGLRLLSAQLGLATPLLDQGAPERAEVRAQRERLARAIAVERAARWR